MRRAIAVSLARLGNIEELRDAHAKAYEHYRESIGIRLRLDARRAEWRRDLTVAYLQAATVLVKLQRHEEAREAADKALEIARNLAKNNPTSTKLRRDLTTSLQRRGDLALLLGTIDSGRA